MMNYDEIAKMVFGENYSYEELVEGGFYIEGNTMQIDSQKCYSKKYLNKIFDLRNI